MFYPNFAGGGSFHHSSKVDLLLDCGLMNLFIASLVI
jgi:hypothetical protein